MVSEPELLSRGEFTLSCFPGLREESSKDKPWKKKRLINSWQSALSLATNGTISLHLLSSPPQRPYTQNPLWNGDKRGNICTGALSKHEKKQRLFTGKLAPAITNPNTRTHDREKGGEHLASGLLKAKGREMGAGEKTALPFIANTIKINEGNNIWEGHTSWKQSQWLCAGTSIINNY